MLPCQIRPFSNDSSRPRGPSERRDPGYNAGVKATFIILVVGDLLLMSLTALAGLIGWQDSAWGVRHALLGVLTGLYTCLVQVVTFMYFVVCGKIVGQAVESGQCGADVLHRVLGLKRRAMRCSAAGIVAILAAVGTGGAAVNFLGSPSLHMVVAFSAVIINSIVFIQQFGIIEQNCRVFDEAFPEAGDTAPSD